MHIIKINVWSYSVPGLCIYKQKFYNVIYGDTNCGGSCTGIRRLGYKPRLILAEVGTM